MNKSFVLPFTAYIKVRNMLRRMEGEEAQEVLEILTNNVRECQSICQSVFLEDMIEKVEEQIDKEDLLIMHPLDKAMINEICLILAEVLITPDRDENGRTTLIKIAKQGKPLSVVRGVFSKLTSEHIEVVIDNFKKLTAKVYNKRAYLTTALYNSVFELDGHYHNQVQSDFYDRASQRGV